MLVPRLRRTKVAKITISNFKPAKPFTLFRKNFDIKEIYTFFALIKRLRDLYLMEFKEGRSQPKEGFVREWSKKEKMKGIVFKGFFNGN